MTIEYINLKLSKDALHTLDELYERLHRESNNNKVINIVATISGILQSIIRQNRREGLIPP
jgi:hypothetical protein